MVFDRYLVGKVEGFIRMADLHESRTEKNVTRTIIGFEHFTETHNLMTSIWCYPE